MAFDPKKIVSVSLNKIAASRTTRSGINLYKSLMVSTVLYRARTCVIMEKYNGPFSQTKTYAEYSEVTEQSSEKEIQTTDIDEYDFEETDSSDSGEQINEIKQTDVDEYDSFSQQMVVSVPETPSESSEDKENNAEPQKNDVIANDSTHKSLSANVLQSCENTMQNLDSKEISKCERCKKRRMTEVESAVDSILPKKTKLNSSEDISNESDLKSKPEPMDGVQITQLVDSFTGLLAQSCTPTPESDQSSFYGQNKESFKGHGLSEAFNYCSSQIKECFETLSAPIIQLGITA